MRAKAGAARILHLHSTFDAGGKEVRNVRLINALGKGTRHDIVSGDPSRRAAADLLDGKVEVGWPDFPPMNGRPGPGRLKALAKAMLGYDLVCTYNWGAMDAVMARTLFSKSYALPPLVHHEDGFNEDEAVKLKASRNLYRRIALGRSAALIVPSRQLEDIALKTWKQPRTLVHRIANGIAIDDFTAAPCADALPGLVKQQGEYWVGTLAGLRKVKRLDVLVRAMAALPENWRLVICGEGPERDALLEEAEQVGIAGRVHLPGFAADPAKVVGLFDIFALSSASEQFPISVVEAMAAGRPVIAPRVGDICHMVSSANGPLLTAAGDDEALAAQLVALAEDAEARSRIGEANRRKAEAEYSFAEMVARYRSLYWGAMRRN